MKTFNCILILTGSDSLVLGDYHMALVLPYVPLSEDFHFYLKRSYCPYKLKMGDKVSYVSYFKCSFFLSFFIPFFPSEIY